ncbi:MAG: hypothetical protein MUE69_29170 [Myxococcota bacterium]|nr:hypothetical protein [Myxococcota bacterium]
MASTKTATPKKATPKKATPKKATPKKATPKNATPKNATLDKRASDTKKATPKKATPKNKRASDTTKGAASQSATELPPRPDWATKLPDADGLLPVPDAKKKTVSAALGSLDRRHSIVRKVGMNAVASRAGTWGLHRQLSVRDGEGPEVRRLLEVLASEGLPIVGLELGYPEGMGPGTPAALAAILEHALSTSAAEHLERLQLVTSVPVDTAVATALAAAMRWMPRLRELDLRGRGGSVLEVLRAAPPLTSLALVSVGVGRAELAELARSPRMADLRTLVLHHLDADSTFVREVVESSTALERIDLSPKLLLPTDWACVASLDGLRDLGLRFPNDETIEALSNAAFVPRLERLRLSDAKIDLPTAKRLAARGLPVLRHLELKHCDIRDAALQILVDAAPTLTTLGIPSTTRPQAWAKRGRTVL